MMISECKKYFFFLSVITITFLFLSTHISSTEAQENIALIYPVSPTGQQWEISQGYNTDAHGSGGNLADLMTLDITEAYGYDSTNREVVAAATGIIWDVNSCDVVIRHGDVYTSYLHIAPKSNLSAGQEILVGTPIGNMVNSGPGCGEIYGVHVHFMLNKWVGNGDPIREFPFGSNWEALPFLNICGDSYPYQGDSNRRQYNNTLITLCSSNNSGANWWQFGDSRSGWQPFQLIGEVFEGDYIRYTVNGADPVFQGPSVNLRAGSYPYLWIRMINGAPDDCIEIYWQRSDDSNFAADRRMSVPNLADGENNLLLHMQTGQYGDNWNGTISRIRIDANCNGADFGTIGFHTVSFIPTWYFPGETTYNWQGLNNVSFVPTTNDGMVWEVIGEDPQLEAPPQLIPTSFFGNIYIEMSTQARGGPGCGYVYWQRTQDSSYSEFRSLRFDTPNDGFLSRVFAMPSDWSYLVNNIRFDPACGMDDNDPNTPEGIRLDNFEILRRLPANEDIVRSGNFPSVNFIDRQSGDWSTYGDLSIGVSGGQARIKRNAGAQSTVSLAQVLHYPVPPNTPVEIRVDLTSESANPIDINVGLRALTGGQRVECNFTVLPHDDPETYIVRGFTTSEFWKNSLTDLLIFTEENYLRVDNYEIRYLPDGLVTTDECIAAPPDPDVNNDGILSPTDAIYVINRFGSGNVFIDMNRDGTINAADVQVVLDAIETNAP